MSAPRWNVLVFPGGTEVGLEIWRSLQPCKEIRLSSASSGADNHAEFVFLRNHRIRDVRQPGWLEDLERVVSEERIDFIFPANAYVIDQLVANRDRLPCGVALAASELVRLTRSKRATFRALHGLVALPQCHASTDAVDLFPVYVKPDDAYGAQGGIRIESRIELEKVLERSPGLLIQEWLPGPEFTVDCLSDAHGRLLFAQGRTRERVRMGTSMHSALTEGELDRELHRVAASVAQRIPLTGAWFLQMRMDRDGRLKLLEVEARIAGTMGLNRARGVNFPLLSLMVHAGMEVQLLVNDLPVVLDRSLVSRFQSTLPYRCVYVDLDDTLVCKGRLNLQLLMFLHQSVEAGKRIVLLSKSLAPDPDQYLRNLRIFDLFDERHWIPEQASKADYIRDPESIFIDDSFSQRSEVARRHGIPTFDASMVECLLDARRD